MEWKNRKVIVAGVSGFVGSNLTKELLKRGAIVYAIDNFSYIDAELAKKKLNFFDKIQLIEGDVSKKESWDKLPKDAEYIFLFAAPSSTILFKRFPEKCYYETVYGLYWAFEYAKANKLKKVVYPTSGNNYAGNKMPLKEDIYTKPRNLYGAAKMACEAIASSYSDFVPSIGFRFFAGYGPGEEWKRDFGSALYQFISDCMNDKSPVIFGDGTQTRDLVYVDDFVRAILKGAEVEYTGVVNVGTGKPISFNDLIKIINKKLGKNIKPEYVKKEANYASDLKAETDLMREVLGFEAVGYEEGISKFVDYLMESK